MVRKYQWVWKTIIRHEYELLILIITAITNEYGLRGFGPKNVGLGGRWLNKIYIFNLYLN